MERRSSAATVRPICPRRLDLKTLIDGVHEMLRETLETRRVEIVMDVPPNLWVELDPILMRDALRKLFENAMEAMPAGGELTITSLIGRHGLEIEIADDGPGIAEEIRHTLFEPFVSAKTDHAGLGLTLVRKVADAHGGSVSAMDCPEGGAAVTLMLPLRSARMAA